MTPRFLTVPTLAVFLGGCASVGPKTVHRDRIDYGSAMSETLKQQTVLNIVKSRYVDWPTFLDVSQIVAGYSRQGSASLGWTWFPRASSSDNLGTSLGGTYTETPTITYAPLTGKNFASTFLQPLHPQSILAVAYTGWKVDRLFELTLNSINGKRNAVFVGDGLKAADPDFWRVLELFRELQTQNAWGLRRKSAPAEDQKADQTGGQQQDQQVELLFRAPDDDAELRRKIAELKDLLGLDTSAEAYRVTYGDQPEASDVIALESRTLWEVFWELQRYVEIPAEDEAAGLVSRLSAAGGSHEPVMRIRSGSSPPATAFVAVRYRGNWFWIDDSDLGSKHSLSIILMMLTLARPEGAEAPKLVIPTR